MTLTDAHRTAIERWLDEHWLGKATCPAGHDDWSIAPNLSFMPGFVVGAEGTRIAHESGFTFVLLTCRQCGHTAFIDTTTMGLTD